MSTWRKRQVQQKENEMLALDYDTADRITLLCLQQHKDLIEKALEQYEEDGKWMHNDDVRYNRKLLKSLNRVIKYFGGGDEDDDQW